MAQRHMALWAVASVSGVGAVGANLGGAVMGERVVRLEAHAELNEKRLERIGSKMGIPLFRNRV